MTARAASGASRTPLAEARGADSSRLFRVDAPLRGAAATAPRRVRVVHCLDSLGVGGTELNMVRTLEHLDRERIEASVVMLNGEGPLRARLDATRLPVAVFPIPNLYGPRAMRQLLRLAAHLRAARADVVHCHDLYTNAFATIAARLAGVPFVLASRRWWARVPRPAHAIANRLGYRLADRVVANSEAVARLVESEGVPTRKLFVLPNFLEEDAFAPMSEAARARGRAELGIPPGARVVGLVARLHAVKRVDLLLDAFARLSAPAEDVHLVIVGDGGERPALEERARALGVAARTHFAGRRPNRPNIHGLFDVSALSSESEGFPNTVVEAMAAGRPVVATAVGGVRDAVEEGRTGLLVPSGDAAAFAAALDALLADPELRTGFGRAGRERARARYHERMVIPTLETLYQTAVAGR